MAMSRRGSVLSFFKKQDADKSVHIYTQLNDVATVQSLCRNKRIVNSTDENGRTPIQIAAAEGHGGLVGVLLSLGADSNKRDNEGFTSLHHACQSQSPQALEICRLLLKDGKAQAGALTNNGSSPLHLFCTHEPVDAGLYESTIELMKSCGADLNAQTKIGETPLFQAASLGLSNVVYSLLRCGSNVNLRTKDGETPLHAAIKAGKSETACILLEHNADPSLESNDGCCRTYSQKYNCPTILQKINEKFLERVAIGNNERKPTIIIDPELIQNLERRGYESSSVMTAIYILHKRGSSTTDENLIIDELDNGTATNANECKICLDKKIDSLLLPCRHSCLCIDCATTCKESGECPICRQKITEAIQVFVS